MNSIDHMTTCTTPCIEFIHLCGASACFMEPQIYTKGFEAEPLLTKPDGALKVYPGRFYVLAVLALLAIQQNIAWMTFGTIPDESYEHFGLSDNEITLLAGRSYVNSTSSPFCTHARHRDQYSSRTGRAHTNRSHALLHFS